MRFRAHKYQWTMNCSVRHQWSFLGPEGGISFSASMPKEDSNFGSRDVGCGLEFHHYFDPSGGQQAPHHAPCWLLGAPCWHDGTSLYASESVWPQIELYLESSDHPSIFRTLEWEYEQYFARFTLPRAIRRMSDD